MDDTRTEIRFVLGDREVRLDQVGPSDTLLDFLRLDQRLTGTKEGCAEGDCGACTVLVGRRLGDGMRYDAVNACIRLLPSVDLCHVVTVEHLAEGQTLHPVQQAMVDRHASQCGFCTPGIVMSLTALWLEDAAPNAGAIETALQGNLCRCTGYAPIIRAAQEASAHASDRDPLRLGAAQIAARLEALNDGRRVETTKGAILPRDTDDLARVLADHPEATIVAGATDVGLWVTKEMRDIAPAVFVSHLPELRQLDMSVEGLTIGGAVSYSDAQEAICGAYPQLGELWHRIGGWQVRNMGTIGGNIANGSPIGDTPPPLIALGAEVTLRSASGTRTLALEDFFIDYGKQDRRPDEFVESVRIPALPDDALLACYKISKRRDEDITAVCGAFLLGVEDGKISTARIAFGGMAATPKRATRTEAALQGQPWTEATIAKAKEVLRTEYTPLSDWRASADYRATVAANLLERFWLEHGAGTNARLERTDA